MRREANKSKSPFGNLLPFAMVPVGWRTFSPSHAMNLTPYSGRQCLKLEVHTCFLLKTRNNLEQVFGVRIS